MSSIEAYPLAWPDGWPRREAFARKVSDYKVTFMRARDELVRELKAGRCRDVVISTNVPLRRDGLPLANTSEPKDPGVAVYWTGRGMNGESVPRVIACDVWRTVRENLRAVGLAYSSLRQIERTGASELLERAFSGFARLPEAADCWSVLGIDRGASVEAVTERFRLLAREHHPDRGGNSETMSRITQAYHEAVAS